MKVSGTERGQVWPHRSWRKPATYQRQTHYRQGAAEAGII